MEVRIYLIESTVHNNLLARWNFTEIVAVFIFVGPICGRAGSAEEKAHLSKVHIQRR